MQQLAYAAEYVAADPRWRIRERISGLTASFKFLLSTHLYNYIKLVQQRADDSMKA